MSLPLAYGITAKFHNLRATVVMQTFNSNGNYDISSVVYGTKYSNYQYWSTHVKKLNKLEWKRTLDTYFYGKHILIFATYHILGDVKQYAK